MVINILVRADLVQFCSEDWKDPLSLDRPAIVAIGKFDALHCGHRSLATRAAQLGGQGCAPFMLSFHGMAQVMGWLQRPPLVAACMRSSILHSWQPHCGGLQLQQRVVPFNEVRNLSPEAFVATLAEHLQVKGIVVGEGFRFGYRAKGDTAVLSQLCTERGLSLAVVPLLSSAADPASSVSSSKVRAALAAGDMELVETFLDRPFTLVLQNPAALTPGQQHRLPLSCLLNQPPGQGKYAARLYSLPERQQVLPRVQPGGKAASSTLPAGHQQSSDLLEVTLEEAHISFTLPAEQHLDGNQLLCFEMLRQCRQALPA